MLCKLLKSRFRSTFQHFHNSHKSAAYVFIMRVHVAYSILFLTHIIGLGYDF